MLNISGAPLPDLELKEGDSIPKKGDSWVGVRMEGRLPGAIDRTGWGRMKAVTGNGAAGKSPAGCKLREMTAAPPGKESHRW